MKNKNTFLFIAGLGFAVLFLWLALKDADPQRIALALSNADWAYAIPFLVVLGMFYWLKAYRWALLLRPLAPVRAGTVFPAIMIGFAGNIFLPAQLGELIRTYVLGNQLKLRKSAVLSSILLERVFDFLTILIILGITLVVERNLPEILVRGGYAIGGISAMLLVFVIIYAHWTRPLLSLLAAVTRFLPARLHASLLDQLETAAGGLAAIKDYRLMLMLMLSSLLQWGLLGICILVSIAAFHIQVPLSGAFLVLALMVATLTLPNTPGYFGPIQLAFTLALKPFGIDPASAFAASMFYHVLAYFSVLIAGFYYTRQLGLTFKRLSRESGR